MKKLAASVLLAAISAVPLIAQTDTHTGEKAGPNTPPKIIQIIRERVKPGKGAAHEKNEALYPALFRKMNFPYYAIGLSAISGKSEAWFLAPVDSFADFAKADKMMQQADFKSEMDRLNVTDGDMLSEADNVIATYDKDLSYRPDLNIGEQRFFMVDVVRVKPGHVDEWKQLRKAINATHEKLNMDEHMVIYEAGFGAPSGTFYVFEPLKSMDELDAVGKMHGDAYQQALGPDFQKQAKEYAASGSGGFERNLFAVNPQMSYMSQEVIASAPDFWSPKAEMHSAAATTKKPKNNLVKPAGMKNETKQ